MQFLQLIYWFSQVNGKKLQNLLIQIVYFIDYIYSLATLKSCDMMKIPSLTQRMTMAWG